MSADYYLDTDLSGIDDVDLAMFRVRLFKALDGLSAHHRHRPFEIRSGIRGRAAQPIDHVRGPEPPHEESLDATTVPEFLPVAPRYRFDQLVLPETVMERLLDTVATIEVAPLVFDRWNLRAIEPNPSVAVSFRGPPGTGKTLAAHAIADRLGRPILSARLSDLESKYHGDGPKNLVGLFGSARRSNAVLFIDEAESLLSRRFAQPSQAAESAINSMRTELLMAVDTYDGIVIFASNLPHSYDAAIESRLVSVDFELPDETARRLIWRAHLPAELPLTADVSVERLATIAGLSGRDIKLAVIAAAVRAARAGLTSVSQELLEAAAHAEATASAKGSGVSLNADALAADDGERLSPAESAEITRQLREDLARQNVAAAADSAAGPDLAPVRSV